MKKYNNYHFLLIGLIVFLFFLSSTALVTAYIPEPVCDILCSGGGGVGEGAYCDFNGHCCCPRFSCIGLICTGCEAEKGDCNVDGDCCSGLYCTDNHCCEEGEEWDETNDRCELEETNCAEEDENVPDDGEYCCLNQGLTECSDGYCRTDCCDNTVDKDNDGYGSPANDDCSHPELDCNDNNINVHPGGTEVCWGGYDEDCDGLFDCDDTDCSSNNYCSPCSNDNDCPDDPSCYKGECVDNKCTQVLIGGACGENGACCYPLCDLALDPDCKNSCNLIPGIKGLGPKPIDFWPTSSSDIGTLLYYNSGGLKFNNRQYGFNRIGIFNEYAQRPCNELKASRGFIMIDTGCLEPEMTVSSAKLVLPVSWSHDGWFSNTRGLKLDLYVDKSGLGENDNDWILNPSSFYDLTKRGLNNAEFLAEGTNYNYDVTSCPASSDYFCIGSQGFVNTGEADIPLDDLNLDGKTRFVFITKGVLRRYHDASGSYI